VELTGDGGGKAPALAQTLRGRSRVARMMVNWLSRGSRVGEVSFRPVEINGGPGALFFDGEQRLIGVAALDVADGEIKGIGTIANPDKLRHLGPVGDLGSVLRARG
jgi:hypothetical protein